MGLSVEAILRARLGDREVGRLLTIADGNLHGLFLYDPHEHRLEPAELRLSLADLEAVMRASDTLNARVDELELAAFATVPGRRREKYAIQYAFGPADGPLYHAFKGALERSMAQMGEITVDEGAGLDGPILTITIASTTENEYRQTKEYIEWLFELAKRSLANEPYKGHLPY